MCTTAASLRPTLLLLLLLLIFLCISLGRATSDELQLLLKLRYALTTSNADDVFTSWVDQNSPCNFTGIVCNSNSRVAEINLPLKGLHGVLPLETICALEHLEKLDLGNNSLRGPISHGLTSCRLLKYLDLGMNYFSGQVPDLSPLTELSFLDLNSSGFSGKFPWKSLQNLTNLAFLSLGDNPFDPTPFPEEVLNLHKLYWLYLTNCSITGQIPHGIGRLSLLENLELSDNQLTGEIPPGIGNLTKLWQLELYNNSLTGKLPVGFGNLTGLVNFDASQNKLEGDLSELRALNRLASLQLFENNLSGVIPEEFGDQFKDLVDFSLYRNGFTGGLPHAIGSWTDFKYIDVSENFLTGPIPPDMCKNGHMIDLLLLGNNFSGSIPESYSMCKSLVRLRVSNNSLSGRVPAGIWGLPNLTVMDLTANHFEGPVTGDIANAKSLGLFLLAANTFSGDLPAFISGASSLVRIELSSNRFSGQIPASIGELRHLGRLYLDSNMFSGVLPQTLSSCLSLTDINLASNSLSGEIPPTIGHLRSLYSLNLSRNMLSGQIPTTLSSSKLSLLDLSNNRLAGPIPESLSIGVFATSFKGNPRLCSSALQNYPPCPTRSTTPHHLRKFLACFIAGLIVLLVSLACYLFLKLGTRNLDPPLKHGSSWDMKSYRILSFTEKDIIDAVRSENVIGKGGSGNVYKVVLDDGTELAVKHIWTSESGNLKSSQSIAPMLTRSKYRTSEFEAEVATLSSMRHVNVVKLLCSITSEDSSLLVYEYLPNGSLWDRLHSGDNKMEMGWEVRYAIALGAAKGLEYLHHGCDIPVIHRDVKSSNILLDEEWKPRIADFGLAKIVQANRGADWTQLIAGTHGYMAPEYAYTCKITEKSDVYSFGVVLMELVTGKRPVETDFGDNKDIVGWVYSNMRSNESLVDLVDSSIIHCFKKDAINVLRIAIHCTAKIPTLRPTMRMVVHMIEEAQPAKLTDIIVDLHKEIKQLHNTTLHGNGEGLHKLSPTRFAAELTKPELSSS